MKSSKAGMWQGGSWYHQQELLYELVTLPLHRSSWLFLLVYRGPPVAGFHLI